MPRLLSPLGSWLREERRLLPSSVQPRRLALVALGLVALTLTLETRRRSEQLSLRFQRQRLEKLELVSVALSDIRRSALDWAHWDETFAFAQGRDPQFVQRSLAQSSLFQGGGVMVLFERRGRPLVSYSSSGRDLSAQQSLRDCARRNLSGLVSLSSAVQLLCPGEARRPYLGVLTQISDSTGTAPAAGALVMFQPLIGEAHGPRLSRELQTLQDQLVIGSAAGQRPLPPPLSLRGPDGQPVGLQRPSTLAPLQQSLREELPLLLAVLLPLLLIRMQLTLVQRRQRLRTLRRERLATMRIRQVCRQLDELLAQLGLSGQGGMAQRLAMGGRCSNDRNGGGSHPLALERRLDAFAQRFQVFLEAARSLARLDPLTQLPNRRFFVEQLGHEVHRHQQEGQPIALLFVDIDRFKAINDSFGHSSGDRILTLVAQRLRQLIGAGDFLARYGGDEFVILHQLSSSETDLAQRHSDSLRFAEAIAAAFDDPVDLDGTAIVLSISLGITLLQAELPRPEAALQQCDIAMLQAKRNKHNRIAIFDLNPDGGAGHDNDYELYSDLLQAIRDHELKVLFQPIVDAQGQPRGVEALARWQHPDRGPIPPDQFLSLAERHRQILRLSDELLHQALIGFGSIHQIQGRVLRLSFNISPSQLEDPQLVARILEQLKQHRIAPEQLTLELTERGFLEGSTIVRSNLNQLREHGIRLSLDDFGTGYSSLSLLTQLRPDEVKIDRSFVAEMDRDPYALAIITLLSRMAPTLGFQLVAEGVEDGEGFERLRRLGIERFQGYWFARPMVSSAVDLASALPALACG